MSAENENPIEKAIRSGVPTPMFHVEAPEDDQIAQLLEARGQQWGDMTETHERIAQVWSGILGMPVQANEVALCMVGLKMVRAQISSHLPDSYDDAEGYTRIARHIVGL